MNHRCPKGSTAAAPAAAAAAVQVASRRWWFLLLLCVMVLVNYATGRRGTTPAPPAATASAFVMPRPGSGTGGGNRQQLFSRQKRATTTTTKRGERRSSSSASSSSTKVVLFSTNDKVEELRAAAAKAREDAERLRQELGQSSPDTAADAAADAAANVGPKKTVEELRADVLPTLLSESDLEKQSERWEALRRERSVTAFGSANIQTYPVSLRQLEERTSLTAESLGLIQSEASLDEFKFATLYVTGGSAVAGVAALALLPENIGATVCYAVALIPVLFLGVGSTAPGLIANVIGGAKKTVGGSGDGGQPDVSVQERIARHEAAHFCCGYWCGLPVRGVSTTAGNAVVPMVEFDAVRAPYSKEAVAALTITAMAGCVGEALAWPGITPNSGSSAEQDLLTLENTVFRRSQAFLNDAAQQDLTRWGALTAALLLRQNAAKYERVVQAFTTASQEKEEADVPGCIAILEG